MDDTGSVTTLFWGSDPPITVFSGPGTCSRFSRCKPLKDFLFSAHGKVSRWGFYRLLKGAGATAVTRSATKTFSYSSA